MVGCSGALQREPRKGPPADQEPRGCDPSRRRDDGSCIQQKAFTCPARTPGSPGPFCPIGRSSTQSAEQVLSRVTRHAVVDHLFQPPARSTTSEGSTRASCLGRCDGTAGSPRTRGGDGPRRGSCEAPEPLWDLARASAGTPKRNHARVPPHPFSGRRSLFHGRGGKGSAQSVFRAPQRSHALGAGESAVSAQRHFCPAQSA